MRRHGNAGPQAGTADRREAKRKTETALMAQMSVRRGLQYEKCGLVTCGPTIRVKIGPDPFTEQPSRLDGIPVSSSENYPADA